MNMDRDRFHEKFGGCFDRRTENYIISPDGTFSNSLFSDSIVRNDTSVALIAELDEEETVQVNDNHLSNELSLVNENGGEYSAGRVKKNPDNSTKDSVGRGQGRINNKRRKVEGEQNVGSSSDVRSSRSSQKNGKGGNVRNGSSLKNKVKVAFTHVLRNFGFFQEDAKKKKTVGSGSVVYKSTLY
jgi:hypothetical protein